MGVDPDDGRSTCDILTRLPNRRHDDSNAADDDVRCPAGVWACPVDVDIARFTIAITVSASYPMLQFVSRACLDDLLVTHGLVAAHERGIPTHRFLIETLFYVVVTTLIAMVEPDVATVMDGHNRNGCVGAAPGSCSGLPTSHR